MLYYVTGNQNKIAIAKKYLTPLNIVFKPIQLPIQEIQSYSIEQISINKAKQAFEILKKPLITNDHGWSITALNGFPGAYMRYVNDWLTAGDFQLLMSGRENREAILTEVLCFIDSEGTKTFTMKHKGTVRKDEESPGQL